MQNSNIRSVRSGRPGIRTARHDPNSPFMPVTRDSVARTDLSADSQSAQTWGSSRVLSGMIVRVFLAEIQLHPVLRFGRSGPARILVGARA